MKGHDSGDNKHRTGNKAFRVCLFDCLFVCVCLLACAALKKNSGRGGAAVFEQAVSVFVSSMHSLFVPFLSDSPTSLFFHKDYILIFILILK